MHYSIATLLNYKSCTFSLSTEVLSQPVANNDTVSYRYQTRNLEPLIQPVHYLFLPTMWWTTLTHCFEYFDLIAIIIIIFCWRWIHVVTSWSCQGDHDAHHHQVIIIQNRWDEPTYVLVRTSNHSVVSRQSEIFDWFFVSSTQTTILHCVSEPPALPKELPQCIVRCRI